MNSFHFREREGSKLPRLYTRPICDFDLRATRALTLLPAALASVSFGFVLVISSSSELGEVRNLLR